MTKKLIHQFEDDLGALVDSYLKDGINIAKMKQVLRYEADYEHVARRCELMEKARQ